MHIQPLKTPLVQSGDTLWPIIRQAITAQVGQLPEKSVVAISSKIISYSQGRLVPKTAADLADPETAKAHKHNLIRQEAERYLEPNSSQYQLMFTVKNGTLAVNAGIDESNAADDQFVLWPENLPAVLAELWQQLKTEYQVKEVGLVVTDSKTYPLRWGVTGTCLAHCGFKALYDCRGQKDLFGRSMQMEQVNVAEAVAISAVLEMGEVAEQTPLAVVTDITAIEFQDHAPTTAELEALKIELTDDVFAPFFKTIEWKQGGSAS
jgi:F420-0:gamma-glutamyl ligase